MNALNTARTASSFRNTVVTLPARRERRERDFGVGYGKSSGYASADRRYAPDWRQFAFRCA